MAPRAGKPLFQAVVDHEQKFKTGFDWQPSIPFKTWVFMLIDSQPTHLNTYISHLKIRAEFLYSVGNARIETTPASPAPAWTLRFFRKGAFFPSIYLGFQIFNLGLFYSVSDAVIIRIESFHWILDISSRWSEVQYFPAPIKRKHSW